MLTVVYMCVWNVIIISPKNIKYVYRSISSREWNWKNKKNRFSMAFYTFFRGYDMMKSFISIHTHKKYTINIIRQFFIIVSVKNFFDQYVTCVCVCVCTMRTFLNCDDFIFHVFLLYSFSSSSVFLSHS